MGKEEPISIVTVNAINSILNDLARFFLHLEFYNLDGVGFITWVFLFKLLTGLMQALHESRNTGLGCPIDDRSGYVALKVYVNGFVSFKPSIGLIIDSRFLPLDRR